MASESRAGRLTSVEERETGCAMLRRLAEQDLPLTGRTGLGFLGVLDSVLSMLWMQRG